jgi:hypothetical protein
MEQVDPEFRLSNTKTSVRSAGQRRVIRSGQADRAEARFAAPRWILTLAGTWSSITASAAQAQG